MYRHVSHLLVASVLYAAFIQSGFAQNVTYSKSGGKTTASKSDYSVGYGANTRNPRNYDYYYYGREYAAAPAVVTTVSPTPVPHLTIGYVKPYSDAEYGDLVIKTMNMDRARAGEPLIGENLPGSAVTKDASATATPAPSPTPADQASGPALEKAFVTDVGDKGTLITTDAGEIRLRGVAFPSLKTKYPERRKFAETAQAALASVVKGEVIYYTVEDPPKGLDGRTLAIVHLKDGTQLNRLAIESGMAIISPGDFADEPVADDLIGAEAEARKLKRGIWAKW
jgi:endonuclease YncB( thermonuclease family)